MELVKTDRADDFRLECERRLKEVLSVCVEGGGREGGSCVFVCTQDSIRADYNHMSAGNHSQPQHH